ncbi:MAG TPA: hypothetical protein VHF58_06805 [Solirubrobacterales bacterium]|nr:hypothetical protein [Solirubrobacterales bacterium]
MPEAIPIACSLERAEMPERAKLIEELGETLVSVEANGRAAVLRFPLDRRDEVGEFVRAESSCCPFFVFDVREHDEVELRIEVPQEGGWALRGLVAGFTAGWKALV